MPGRIRQLNFDLAGMQSRALVGVRRAAAFLGLSERFLENELPRSLTLGSGIKHQFLPDPLPDEIANDLREAWHQWIIGNAIRELDQYLSLFLDEGFDLIEQARILAGEAQFDHTWDRIDKETNIAKKHQLVLRAANKFSEQSRIDYGCLLSLSRVRNCLSHGLGRVTEERASGGSLQAQWLGLRFQLVQGEMRTDLTEAALPWEAENPTEPASIEAQVKVIDKAFPVGEIIDFTPSELLEICLFYNMVIDRVTLTLQEYAIECGVDFSMSKQEFGAKVT